MAELLSKGIHLDICDDISEEPAVWRKLYGLSEVPDIGGDPEKIEVTNLEDSNVRYINGIEDFGDLEFTFFYNKESSADAEGSAQVKESYSVLRSYQVAGKSLYYRLIYPDGTGHQWHGSVNVKRTGVAVNEALGFTLSTSLDSKMTDITEVDS